MVIRLFDWETVAEHGNTMYILCLVDGDMVTVITVCSSSEVGVPSREATETADEDVFLMKEDCHCK